MISDKALVEGCAKGDRKVQQVLYDQFCRRLLAICIRYARSVPEAEDILQEGFIKAFDHIKNFRYESKLETWLTRIMINTALNYQRKKLYLFPMIDVDVDLAVNIWNVHNIAFIIFCLFITKSFYGPFRYKFTV